MKIYKSCKTLPIRKFFRIFETDDLRNLVIGFDEENDTFTLKENQLEEFAILFEDIYFEYSDISENHKLKSTLKKRFLIEEWSLIYMMISSFINLYIEHKSNEPLDLINSLEEVQYHIDLDKPIDPQIKKLVQKMKGLKNKINIFKLKLSQSMEKNEKDVKMDLDRDALYLERNLELKRAIDPDTTSVTTWVRMIQMNKQKVKDYAKNRH